MRAEGCISPDRVRTIRLGARAPGFSAFLGLCACLALPVPILTAPAHANDTIASEPDAEAVRGQADRIRGLFEAAGRSGLVALKDRGDAATAAPVPAPNDTGVPAKATQAEAPAASKPADCLALAPLFDGGQGGFATGKFVELSTDWPETADLARTLSDLIDPGYGGLPVALDLSQAGECGVSFLPWQALADPGRPMDAVTEAALTGELAKMQPALRRLLGVRIATRAALLGNDRLTRRVTDTLVDSGLHGLPRHDADPEHVLLDALIVRGFDAVSARARLSWLAERDGPEQLVAIDLLRDIDAAPVAQAELRRLSDSPDERVQLDARKRLLANAVEDADIELVAEMVTLDNNLTDDAQSRAHLAARLSGALDEDDLGTVIRALDVVERLDAKGVTLGADLHDKAKARRARLAGSDTPAASAPADVAEAASAADAPASPDMTQDGVGAYLDGVTEDMNRFEEVLRRG